MIIPNPRRESTKIKEDNDPTTNYTPISSKLISGETIDKKLFDQDISEQSSEWKYNNKSVNF